MTIQNIKTGQFPLYWTNEYKKLSRYWGYTFLIWTLIEIYFTSVSYLILFSKGHVVSWFHLSLNYFSKGWMWAFLMPVIYLLYRKLFCVSLQSLPKLGKLVLVALPFAIIHVFASYYFDLLLRRTLNIIDLDFWWTIQENVPILIKSFSTSFLTFILIIGCLTVIKPGRNKENTLKKKDSIGKFKKTVSNNTYPERLTLKSNNKIILIKASEIQYLQSEGNYIKVHLPTKHILIRETLKHLQSKLNPASFYRINRSAIINIDAVKELEPWFNGEYTITLHNTKQIRTSKTYRENLNRLLGTKT